MKSSACVIVPLLVIALSSCTTELNSRRIVAGSGVALAGTPYNLPYTRFKLDVIRRVASCLPAVEVKTRLTAVPEQRRDPSRSYVIDLASLQSFFKSSSVQVSYYDTGTIKSINGAAEDKTGEFIVGTLKSAATLVASASGISTPSGLDERTLPRDTCTAEVARAVARLASQEPLLKSRTSELERMTEQFKQHAALFALLGKAASVPDREAFARRLRALVALQEETRQIARDIARMLELVSVNDTTTWPDNGETFVSPTPVFAPVEAAVFEKWLNNRVPSPDLRAGTAVYLQIQATEPIGRAASCGDHCPDDGATGLKYRLPAEGTLSMCARLAPARAGAPARCEAGEVVMPAGLISQLGRVYALPLKSTAFSSRSVTASFTEAGIPTLIGTTSGAASDKAGAALAGAVGAASLVKDSRAQREANDLEGRLKVLKLKKELELATVALAPPVKDPKQDATNAFTVDTALLSAELANLEARRALDEARQAALP
jgi:hypothetical protein